MTDTVVRGTVTVDWYAPNSCPNNATCVEVAALPTGYDDPRQVNLIRWEVSQYSHPNGDLVFTVTGWDADGRSETLTFDREEWVAFLASVEAEQYDSPENLTTGRKAVVA